MMDDKIQQAQKRLMSKPIAWVRGFVTPEQKLALMDAGKRIVDASFAPADAEIIDFSVAPKKKRGRPPKQVEPDQVEDSTETLQAAIG